MDQIFTGELSEVDSAEVLRRQCVSNLRNVAYKKRSFVNNIQNIETIDKVNLFHNFSNMSPEKQSSEGVLLKRCS